MGGDIQQQQQQEEEKEDSEYSDFVDFGGIDYELADIKRVLEVKNTTKDKLAYTLFCLNIFFTCFLVGFAPKYFYLWHTWIIGFQILQISFLVCLSVCQKAVLLISYRCYSYAKLRFQFFLLDFCYFTNILILLYLWLPQAIIPAHFRGALFTTCFSFANGPVLSAIVLWKNSLVPHSNDKMTSLFIHVSPALTLWSIRWFTDVDQGFPLCYHYDPANPSLCDSAVDFKHIFIYPIIAYVVWQLLYVVMVDIIGYKKVKEGDYATSFSYLSKKKGFLVKIFYMFGPTFAKPMFILWQFIYTFIFLVIAYFCYFNLYFNIFAVTVAMTSAAYNGASFYIDVFSVKYRRDSRKSS